MVNTNSTIALVTSNEFKWTAEIQYKESLPNRDEAIRYASRHGFNLIVKYDKRSGPLFDVMFDPQQHSTAEANAKKAETVSVTMEPEHHGWRMSKLRNMFGLARRVAAVAGVSH
jgi:hypothetical protein